MNPRKTFLFLVAITLLIIVALSFINYNFLWSLLLIGPIIIIGFVDFFQTKHTIRRNFPVIGNLRYFFEAVRPEIMQYFVETDTEGRPFSRIFRSIIYQRAKRETDTTPFGTQTDVYQKGYEWMDHSMYPYPEKMNKKALKVKVGGKNCTQPYKSSILNISAMSFGSLSDRAIMALNMGAKYGGFAHNTGEGGISPHHLKYRGDIIWQIGTGYFGCRTEDGKFSSEKFVENAKVKSVKMIEVKISQGAKPGHGGILPASKNTPEIAKIRGIKPYVDVHSPPTHSAFSNAEELMHFVQRLRELSGGKPVGFKLCIGKKREFVDLCKAMIKTGLKPDFISIDGGEGGTGAAPIEFSNSLGMPLRDGLSFAYDTLVGYDLKEDIKIVAAGKITTGFHAIRTLALGADMLNSARAMMMAVGCIQALKCNTNTCPVGVATQNQGLIKGLVVKDKAKRVTNYHRGTIKSIEALTIAAGFSSPKEITRMHINRRVNMNESKRFDQIYPEMEKGCLLNPQTIPSSYQNIV